MKSIHLLLTLIILTIPVSAMAQLKSEIVPSEGLWWIPSESGTGIVIDRQDKRIVLTMYTYDEQGNAQWLVGNGPYENGIIEAQMVRAENGSCFNCPYQAPDILDDGVTVTIQFVATDFGFMTFDGGEPKVIRSFWYAFETFGVGFPDPELGAPVIPDLAGRWTFVSEDPADSFHEVYTVDCCSIIDPPTTPTGAISMGFTDDQGELRILLCVAVDERRVVPYCWLVEDALLPMEQWTAVFSFYVRDVGINRITAYLGDPVPADSESVRGERLIYGFRVPSR